MPHEPASASFVGAETILIVDIEGKRKQRQPLTFQPTVSRGPPDFLGRRWGSLLLHFSRDIGRHHQKLEQVVLGRFL